MKKPTRLDAQAAQITIAEDGETLQIKRNARTMAAAQRLSDYLHSLECLTAEQNNKLIELVLDQMKEAEIGAFLAGADMAAEMANEGEREHKPPIKILQ